MAKTATAPRRARGTSGTQPSGPQTSPTDDLAAYGFARHCSPRLGPDESRPKADGTPSTTTGSYSQGTLDPKPISADSWVYVLCEALRSFEELQSLRPVVEWSDTATACDAGSVSDLADPSVERGLQPDATRLETPHAEGEDGEAFDMPSSYLAPEFVESGHASPAADVFSAGVILWELLANQHRPSVSGEGMLPVLDENRLLPRLSEVAEGIDPALETLVEKALKPDYRERFATVTEFRMALEDFIQERFGVAAPQSGLIPRSEALSFARMMRTGLPPQESPALPHEADFRDSCLDFDGEDTVSRDNLPSLSNFRIPGL